VRVRLLPVFLLLKFTDQAHIYLYLMSISLAPVKKQVYKNDDRAKLLPGLCKKFCTYTVT